MNYFLRLIAVTLLLAAPVALQAQGAQLDANFPPVISDGRAAGRFVALQPDGKILADNLRIRYNPDGSRDTTYTLGPTLGFVSNARVAVDGKIVSQSRTAGDDVLLQLNADGSLDRVLVPALPNASFVALQPDGKILLTSPFTTTINGITRNGIARLNRDGSLDSSFDPGLGPQGGGGSLTLALQADGKLLVSGLFTTFDGAARSKLVRLNSNGTVDLSFNFPATGTVTIGSMVALPDGKILAIDMAPPSSRLLRLNADGSPDLVVATDQGANAFALQLDGRVLVGGVFTSFNGVPRLYLVRLNVDGSLDLSFNADAAVTSDVPNTGGIRQLAVQADGKILFAEDHFLNNANDRLVRLNSDGSADATFQPGQPKPPASLALARQADGQVVIAGPFTLVNGVARPGLARLNNDGSLDTTFNPAAGANAPITAVTAVAGGGVIASGSFTGVGGNARSGLARFSATGALDATLNPTLNPGGTIAAMVALPDGRVVLGGNFSSINGVTRGNLAALLADGSIDPAFAASAPVNGPVRLLALRPNGGIFAAGTFSTVAGQRRNNLAALAADGSLDASFVPSQLTTADGISVLAAAPDGAVIIGGSPPAGSVRSALRRLMGNGDIDPAFTFGLAVNAEFSALAIDAQGRAVAAYTGIETRDSFSDTSHRYLQRFTPTGALDPLFNVGAGPSAPVSSIVVAPDGTILAGGAFRSFDDLPIGPLVRLPPGAVPPPNVLFNISTRGETSPGSTILTAGFVIGGSVPKTVLLRATGPGLTAFGVANTLLDPIIILRDVGGSIIASNDNWNGLIVLLPRFTDAGFNVTQTAARVGAFPWQSPLEAAVVATLAPGNYTAQVSAAGGTQAKTTGITLIEVYDANVFPGDRRLVNISTRGTAGRAERTLIAGFVITGTTSKTVLIRASGPGLAPFNVAGTITDPMLRVVNNAGSTIAVNDDWSAGANKPDIIAAAAKVGAFSFADPSKDSALLVTLPPGGYTALVNSADGGTGVALVEVYEVP